MQPSEETGRTYIVTERSNNIGNRTLDQYGQIQGTLRRAKRQIRLWLTAPKGQPATTGVEVAAKTEIPYGVCPMHQTTLDSHFAEVSRGESQRRTRTDFRRTARQVRQRASRNRISCPAPRPQLTRDGKTVGMGIYNVRGLASDLT
jgi:hypothetical protein